MFCSQKYLHSEVYAKSFTRELTQVYALHNVDPLVETAVSTDAQMRNLQSLLKSPGKEAIPDKNNVPHVNFIVESKKSETARSVTNALAPADDAESGHRVCVVVFNTHDMRVTDHAALHAAVDQRKWL